jgi:Carboxypeptidase regulatory-like domain
MKMKRKPRKRSGTNRTALGLLAVVCVALSFLQLEAAPKKKPVSDTYAVVSGSVFDGSGYALPDANVVLAFDAQPKAKPLEGVSDARGEFVFRVPPGPAHYTVTVEAKGHQAQRKTVSVEDQERVEVTFQLEKQSK